MAQLPNALGWIPAISFEDMVAEMVQEDLIIARRDNLCRQHGFYVQGNYEG